MKITKSQLKQLIKEELEQALEEAQLSPAIAAAMQSKGMSTAGNSVGAAPSKQNQNAAGIDSGRMGFQYAKMIRAAEDELKDAEAQGAVEHVFKLKQKIAMLKKRMASLSEADQNLSEQDLSEDLLDEAPIIPMIMSALKHPQVQQVLMDLVMPIIQNAMGGGDEGPPAE